MHKMAISAIDMEQSTSAANQMVVPTLPSMEEYAGGTVLSSGNALPMAARIERRTEGCAGNMVHR